MVTGSMSVIDGEMMTLSVPPITGSAAALALADGEAESPLLSPPQAASSEPATVAEKPKTEARTSS